MSAAKTYPWWTPGGWDCRVRPLAYTAVLDAEYEDYAADMATGGYTQIDSTDELTDSGARLELEIWRHQDGHVIVELWNTDERLSQFFVASQWSDVFFVTRYLEMRRELETAGAAYTQKVMLKAFLAFVRHGHGEDVIDDEGWKTKDERAEAQRQALERQQRQKGTTAT